MQQGIQQSELYKWGLDIDDVVVTIEMNLRGNFWDAKERTWSKKGIELMNEQGVNFVSTIVRARLGRHIAMTDLDVDNIKLMALEVCEDVANVLENKWRLFGVEIAYLSTVLDMIDHLVYTTLRRALNGGERAFIKEIAPESRNITSDSGNKPSFFPPIPFFNKGGNR
jgi:hypothetical protein